MDIQNGHNFATGLQIDVMFGSNVGFSKTADLMVMVQLSMTLSDPEPQLQGHSLVQRRISRKRCVLRPNISSALMPLVRIRCIGTLHVSADNIFNPSTRSLILLHQREAGVKLTPRILCCILLVISGVLNANQLISLRTDANSIILLPLPGGIAIWHVCWFVCSCVREHA